MSDIDVSQDPQTMADYWKGKIAETGQANDFERLRQMGCTDIKGGMAGKASFAEGWHNPSKNRLCILRYGDMVKQVKVPAEQNFIKHTAMRGARNAIMEYYRQPDYQEVAAALDMVLQG